MTLLTGRGELEGGGKSGSGTHLCLSVPQGLPEAEAVLSLSMMIRSLSVSLRLLLPVSQCSLLSILQSVPHTVSLFNQ